MYVTNLEKAVDLYQPLLNAVVVYRTTTEALLETTKIRLKLSTSETPILHERNPVRVSVKDLGDTAKHLLKSGATLEPPVDLRKELGESEVAFLDPDANFIVIDGPNRDHASDEELKQLLAN